jgi:ketosteroid isomerase-like protein
MSQGDRVDIVKAAINAYNREDWDALFEAAAPGFELDVSLGMGPGRGVYRLGQLRRYLTDFAANWESVQLEPNEFIEAGDFVVVPQTTRARGRDGIELVARPTLVWTIRDGAIEQVCLYQERQDAIEAVGLAGEGA